MHDALCPYPLVGVSANVCRCRDYPSVRADERRRVAAVIQAAINDGTAINAYGALLLIRGMG